MPPRETAPDDLGDEPPPPSPARPPLPSIADEVSENEIETSSLSGTELDALLASERPQRLSLDGETSELTQAEVDTLLARARPPLPAPRPAPPDADRPPDQGDAFQDEPTVEQSTSRVVPAEALPQEAIITRVAPRVVMPPGAIPPRYGAQLRRPAAASLELEATPPASSPISWPQGRSVRGKVAIAAGALGGLACAVWLIASGESEPEVPAVPTAASVEAPRPAPIATQSAAQRSNAETERQAREALERLRDGMRACVKQAAMVLPGSSPAVPTTLKAASGEGYASTVADFRTPVWSCAKFHVDGPLRFQIQWQLTRGSNAGMGIAWLDDDGDGRADRAFAFSATLKQRGQMDATPVEAVAPTHAVLPISY